MTTSSTIKRNYTIAISLFSSLFLGSVIFGFTDIQASYDEYRHLQFPEWLLYPLSFAKALGVYAILRIKSQSIKDFAYAGFLFDLLCALGGHIAQQEIKIILPAICLLLWAYTYQIDRKYHDSLLMNDKNEN